VADHQSHRWIGAQGLACLQKGQWIRLLAGETVASEHVAEIRGESFRLEKRNGEGKGLVGKTSQRKSSLFQSQQAFLDTRKHITVLAIDAQVGLLIVLPGRGHQW